MSKQSDHKLRDWISNLKTFLQLQVLGAGIVAHVVDHLPSKHEVLSIS
jgi:hypothetical protein